MRSGLHGAIQVLFGRRTSLRAAIAATVAASAFSADARAAGALDAKPDQGVFRAISSLPYMSLTSGKTKKFEDAYGRRAVVLIAWASWCKWCDKEFQEWKSLKQSLPAPDLVEFVHVNVDDDRLAGSKSSLARGLAPDSLFEAGGRELRKLMNVNMLPVAFIFDRDRKYLARFDGYSPQNMSKAKAALIAATSRAGKPSAADAILEAEAVP